MCALNVVSHGRKGHPTAITIVVGAQLVGIQTVYLKFLSLLLRMKSYNEMIKVHKEIRKEGCMNRNEIEYDLEKDLQLLAGKVNEDYDFAQELYAALCNMRWKKHYQTYACSWRYAGGLIAEMRGMTGEWDYLKFYCSGNEGRISERVRMELEKLGWEPLPWEYYIDSYGQKQLRDDRNTELLTR